MTEPSWGQKWVSPCWCNKIQNHLQKTENQKTVTNKVTLVEHFFFFKSKSINNIGDIQLLGFLSHFFRVTRDHSFSFQSLFPNLCQDGEYQAKQSPFSWSCLSVTCVQRGIFWEWCIISTELNYSFSMLKIDLTYRQKPKVKVTDQQERLPRALM